MRRALLLLGILAVALAGCQTLGQQVPAGLTDYFPNVLASVYIQPGQEAKVTVPDQYTTGKVYGYMTITIPADAFTVPVRFDVLASPNSDWDSKVASDLMVVANFAYRVVDLSTGKLVEKFNKPATYAVTDSMIDMNSVYWAVVVEQAASSGYGAPSATAKLVDANAASKIMGNTLEHGTPVASVGWIVTTPKKDLAAKM
jgi:hypothetical protein